MNSVQRIPCGTFWIHMRVKKKTRREAGPFIYVEYCMDFLKNANLMIFILKESHISI